MCNKLNFLSQIKKSLYACKENLKDEKGQLTLYALLLSMMLLCYTLFIIIKCQRTHLELKTRLQTYQCLHTLDVETSSYIKGMGNLNKAIWLAHKAIFIPATSAQAQKTHQALILIQDVFHFSYLKNILKTEQCSLAQKTSYATKIPYKTEAILFLKHEFDGTVSLQNKEWETWILALQKQKVLFALKAKYKVDGKFSSKSQFEVSEETAY